MKKIFALLIALLMMATLVACSNDDTGNPLETMGIDDNSYSNNDMGSFTYEVSADGHYEITGYSVNTKTEHKLVIPSEIDDIAVTGIAAEALKSCTSITEVTIPDSVKYIGDLAFYDCDNLKTITIADSVETIGVGAFRGCDVLNNVKLPASLTVVSEQLFWECPSLSKITFGAKTAVIGTGAFYNCDALTAIVIPSTVTEIQEAAFAGCDKLVSVTVPASVTKVANTAFANIAAEEVTFNATKDSYFVKFFEENYGINEKDYSHYVINVK